MLWREIGLRVVQNCDCERVLSEGLTPFLNRFGESKAETGLVSTLMRLRASEKAKFDSHRISQSHVYLQPTDAEDQADSN